MQLCVQELIQVFAAMPEDRENDAGSPPQQISPSPRAK